jgi:hypothetical protein
MPLPPVAPSGVGTAFQYPTQATTGIGIIQQLNALPGDVNPPIFFEPGPLLTNDRAQLFIIVTGAAVAWGGCIVNLSLDNTTFGTVGTILRGGIQGVTTATFPSHADPDTVDTLSVDITMSGGQIIAGTVSDADHGVTLLYVGGELVCYTAATLTSAFNYDLDTYIRRGFYGSPIGSHGAGSQFAFVSTSTFQENFLPQLIGTTVYFKFQSFNNLGGAIQDLATVTSYPYTLLGTGFVPKPWYQSVSVGGKFTDIPIDTWDGNYELFDVEMPVPVTFPAGFGSSPVPGCEIAPAADVHLTFQTIHSGAPTTRGTLDILAGNTTGGFTVASGFTVPAGDRLRCYAPAAVDQTIVGLFGTIVGTR